MLTLRAAARPLLTCDGRYDRSAITSAACVIARAALIPAPPIRGYTPAPLPTLGQAFAASIRRAWDLACGQRACLQHHAAAIAEVALPTVERDALSLRDARAIAPMTDFVAIDARALALGVRL